MQINSFTGDYSFLSNFHPALIVYGHIEYPTAEHAFQAAKTHDVLKRRVIATIPTPGQAKRAGRKLQLRNDWEDAKLDVMRLVVNSKFIWNPALRHKLLATGDAELVEGNDWGDVFWGVCQGRGENHLGKILMATRDNMESLDRWLRVDILSPEDLVKDRAAAARFYRDNCQGVEPAFTCDDCWMPRACSLAFDSYNTNGDCLLEK